MEHAPHITRLRQLKIYSKKISQCDRYLKKLLMDQIKKKIRDLHVFGFVPFSGSGLNYIAAIVINFIEVGVCSVYLLFKEWHSVSLIFS
jgi:hypothetical protein